MKVLAFFIVVMIATDLFVDTMGEIKAEKKVSKLARRIEEVGRKEIRKQLKEILRTSTINVTSETSDIEAIKHFCEDENRKKLKSCQRTPQEIHAQDQNLSALFTDLTDRVSSIEDCTETEETIQKRKKRNADTLDPCTNGVAVQKILYYVYNDNGDLREVVHSPADYIYQTFFVFECDPNSNIPSGFSCYIFETLSKAAVWNDYGGIDVEWVVIPCGCGLLENV